MRNHTIDAGRFIAAILVVLLHAIVFNVGYDHLTFSNYHWFRPMIDLAVPFFFTVTGFFLSQRKEADILIQGVNHLKLYLIYSILFTLFTIFRGIVIHCQGSQNFKSFIKAQMNALSFINGTFAGLHLWYLLAGGLGLYLFYHLLTRQLALLEIMGMTIFSWGLIEWSGFELIGRELIANGGFIKALLFITLGYYLGKYHRQLHLQPWLSAIFFVIYYLFHRYYDLSMVTHLSLFVLLALLFPVLVKSPGRATIFSRWGAKYSLLIYIYHPIVIYSYALFRDDESKMEFYSIKIILLSLISILLSILIGKKFDDWYRPFIMNQLAKIFPSLNDSTNI